MGGGFSPHHIVHARYAPEAAQGSEMRLDGVVKRFVFQIRHTKFVGGFFHNACDVRIVDVANFGKKVVLYLIIQPADVPREQPIAG